MVSRRLVLNRDSPVIVGAQRKARHPHVGRASLPGAGGAAHAVKGAPGMGAAWRLGESSTGRRKRATWSKNAGPAMPPSSILVTDAWLAFAKAEA